jgi:hypothetical protein
MILLYTIVRTLQSLVAGFFVLWLQLVQLCVAVEQSV